MIRNILSALTIFGAIVAISGCYSTKCQKKPVVAAAVPAPAPEPTPPPAPPAPPPPPVCQPHDIVVHHKTGKHELTPSSADDMKTLASCMVDNPNKKIFIQGHADPRGSAKLNMKLSKERAETVQKYMMDNGVKAEQIRVEWYGSKKPIAKGKTKEDYKLDRETIVTVEN
jgi:OOP family OmpA-OmpF porin